MNALLWSAAKPVTVAAGMVVLALIACHPAVRARLARVWLRTWTGTSDDAITPAGGDAWDETYWHHDEHGNPVDPLRDAPAREMCGELDEDDEGWLYELGAHTWPHSEYMAIIRRETRPWRRAARRIRRRTGATS